MTHAIGSVFRPRRVYPERDSPYTTPPGMSGGKTRLADPRELVDVRRRFSGVATVISAPLTSVVITGVVWDPSTSVYRTWASWNTVAWAPSTVYANQDLRSSSGKLWRCMSGGTSSSGAGPSGTGTVADGTCFWQLVTFSDGVGVEEDAVVFPDPVYECAVWDVVAGAVVNDHYPQSELLALTTHDAWVDAASYTNPTDVLPLVSLWMADGDRPPDEVIALRRAIEIGGG